MSNLKGARTDAGLDYLLYESAPSKRKSSRRPLLIVTTAAFGVLVLVSALVFLVLPGSGPSSAATQPSAPGMQPSPGATSSTAQAPAAAAAAPTSTHTPAPTPTPTIARPTPAAGEGAVSGPLSDASPSAAPPRFVSPVQVKPRVTDGFGAPRGDTLFHAGVDIISTTSAEFEVVASCDGTVAGADHSSTYADFVVVDCGNSWRTVYAQMSQISGRPGQSVTAGVSVLGRVQGFLHFEIRWADAPTNPALYVDFNALPAPASTPTSTPAGATPASTPTTPPPDTSGTQPPAPTPTSTATATPTPTPTPIPPTAVPTPTSTPTPRAARRTATPPPASQ